MTQQTHPGLDTSESTSGAETAENHTQQTLWSGEPTPLTAPSASTHNTSTTTEVPVAQSAPQSPYLGQSPYSTPTSSYGTPTWYGVENGGGGTTYPPAPVTTPQSPKRKQGKGILQLGAVALLAAALASAGTYAATQAADNNAGTTSSTSSNPAAPVVQANGSTPDWTATAKAVAPSVVSITMTGQQGTGAGSGVVIDKSGHILTNNHVATGAGTDAKIEVTLNDGRTFDAKVAGTDPSTDLAVLTLVNPPNDLTPISIGDSSKLTVGQPVMAVGNPLGLSGTVTTGIVSALNRPVTTQGESTDGQGSTGGDTQASTVVTNAIQTSAAINPGNSGGALVTADGQLIGINSSIASLGQSQGGSQSGNIGIGFAIPANEAKAIADQLIAKGSAEHAYLGVSATDTTVADGSSKRAAAQVRSVAEGTPAASAGLKQGDAIIAVDGNAIESSEGLVATIHSKQVGDKVTLTVLRDGAKQDITITLAARPSQGS